MKNWLSAVPLKTVFSLLPDHIKQKSSLDCLEELKASSEKDLARKRFYKLNLTDSETIHLTYGPELDYQYENSKALHEAIPAFTCKPLFINNKDEYSLFGQEFFEGQAIDDLYNDCKIEKSEVTEILEKIHSIFQNLEKPSSIESANEEFKGFCKTILENKLFSEVDFQILEKEIFPLISSWIEKTNPTIRWSTGDLAARNILVNNNNDFRMLDCEFACKTHFHQEDWIRLSKFSVGKFSEHTFVTGISDKITLPLKLFNLLKQTNLNRFVHNKIDYNFYLNQDVFDAFQEILNIGEIKSIFLKAFSGRYEVMSDSFQQEQLLNSKLQEDQEKLTHEIDELSEFKTNSLQQIKQLQQTSVEYQEKLSQKENKILRMQQSFSWKITGPLRFLRRYKEKFFKDFPKTIHYQKHPIASAYSKQKKEEKTDHDIPPFELAGTYSAKPGSIKPKVYDSNCLKIVWLIPDFGIGSGGHTTIFRTIKWLEQFGHNSKIYICGKTHHQTKTKAKKIIKKYFFDINADLEILSQPSLYEEDSDIIVSTSYETCYYSRAITSDASRFYFVQDYEPDFAPLGSYYFLAKQTYNFGFRCITAGKWLAGKIESVGGEVSCYFELAVDKSIFFPRVIPPKDKKSPPRIVVYARSGTPRRLTEISIFALNILAKRNLRFSVSFFGETSLPIYANFQHEILGILDSKSLSKLYCSSDLGCVFSGTNYSLVPLEMMACGLPLIEFDGKNTRETYPENSVFFSKPDPLELANVIETALSNKDLSMMVRKNALDFVKNLSWEKSIKQIEKGFLQV
jgi:glycosyltransferase involved in cell wall biosynthesis